MRPTVGVFRGSIKYCHITKPQHIAHVKVTWQNLAWQWDQNLLGAHGQVSPQNRIWQCTKPVRTVPLGISVQNQEWMHHQTPPGAHVVGCGRMKYANVTIS